MPDLNNQLTIDLPESLNLCEKPNSVFKPIPMHPSPAHTVAKVKKQILSNARVFEGAIFRDKAELKLQVGLMCVEDCFQIKVVKSSTRRYQAVCQSTGCEWVIRSYRYSESHKFYVKHFNNHHTCSRTQTYPHIRQANKKVVAHLIKEGLDIGGRTYRGKEIIHDIREKYKIQISYRQAWRGKSYALELLQGTSGDSFCQLPYYFYNLELSNPGTVTDIMVDDENRFEMCFMAIGVAVQSYINCLRSVIIVDGAHLKGEFKGTMFLAVAMDGNNQILPLAYGIGKTESGESWTWFLSKLKECIGSQEPLSVVSDRAASISLGVQNVFPQAFHGICCRHLLMNLNLGSSKAARKHKAMWWKACKSYRISDCEESLQELCVAVPHVRDILENVDISKWSRAHSPGARFNIMTSNSAESMNALSVNSRHLPITKLLEFFRASVQEWYFERRQKAAEHPNQVLTDWATKKIGKKIPHCATWKVSGIDPTHFQVADRFRTGLVDLDDRTCSCRVWQLSGLPCGHVIAVSRFLKQTDVSNLAMVWFTRDVYKLTYTHSIKPLPDESEWERPHHLIKLLPPLMNKRQSGRPRANKRIPSQGEEITQVSCTRCGEAGHHRDTCQKPMPSQVLKQSDPCEAHQGPINVEQSDFREFPLPPDAVQLHFPDLHFPNIPPNHRITLWYSEDQHWEVGFGIRNMLLSFTHGWSDVVQGIPLFQNYWVTFTRVSAERYDMVVYSPNCCDIRDLIQNEPVVADDVDVDTDDDNSNDSDDDVVVLDGWDGGDLEDVNVNNQEAGVAGGEHGEVVNVDAIDVADVEAGVDVEDANAENEEDEEILFDRVIIARARFRLPQDMVPIALLQHHTYLVFRFEDVYSEALVINQEMSRGRPRFWVSGWTNFVRSSGIQIGQQMRLRYRHRAVTWEILLSNV
ncbi:hypothetical protein SSX86_015219 [Deinandra increscens subsp. villosa]|uniref:Transposase n=1 Tax=Deinandra increscens subsp. villosa TaxID=3103831 RepID=A0AAP0GWE8_9ASTR